MHNESAIDFGVQAVLAERIGHGIAIFQQVAREHASVRTSAQARLCTLLCRYLRPVFPDAGISQWSEAHQASIEAFSTWEISFNARRAAFEAGIEHRHDPAGVAAERLFLEEDLRYVVERIEDLLAQYEQLFSGKAFRSSRFLLTQVSRFKKYPGSAGFVDRLAMGRVQFEVWRKQCD